MAYEETWDTTYNNTPVMTNKVRDTPNFIKSVRKAIRERFNKEHNFNLADSLTENQGKHNEGSARVFVQTTAPADPSVTKETVYVEGETPDFKQGRPWFDPKTRKFYIYVKEYLDGSTPITVDAFVDVTPRGSEEYDLIVDSNERLADWAAGGTYEKVLIKKGTWTLASGGVDLTAAGTKLVVGEPGSKLVFSSAEKGLYYTTLPTTNDYRMEGVTVECTGYDYGYGFNTCTNLTNCTGTGTGSGDGDGTGFFGCTNLTNCTGTGTGTSYGDSYGFNTCTNLTNCTGTGTGTGYGAGYGFRSCTTLTNCTGTGTGTGTGYGFRSCHKMQQNKPGNASTTSTYGTSYADSGTSYPCADTPNGGFNS